MAKNVDIIDVMIAVNRGELKIVVKNGFFLLEDTISGERVRLNETDVICKRCRYYEKAEYDDGYKMVCRLLKRQTAPDGFCYCGVRREDNA